MVWCRLPWKKEGCDACVLIGIDLISISPGHELAFFARHGIISIDLSAFNPG
jgi:hypothetical protein